MSDSSRVSHVVLADRTSNSEENAACWSYPADHGLSAPSALNLIIDVMNSVKVFSLKISIAVA